MAKGFVFAKGKGGGKGMAGKIGPRDVNPSSKGSSPTGVVAGGAAPASIGKKMIGPGIGKKR